MQVFGNIATPVEKKIAKSGEPYYKFRLAENHGKDEHRTTMWYEVTAFIGELDADMLSKGQFVKISGRLEVEAFKRRNGEPGAAANILTNKVEAVESNKPPAERPAA